MEEAGLRGTETFRKLQQEAGRASNSAIAALLVSTTTSICAKALSMAWAARVKAPSICLPPKTAAPWNSCIAFLLSLRTLISCLLVPEISNAELEAEYKRLGVEASKALSAGHKEEAAALQTKQAQLREEITLRQTVIDEAGKQGRKYQTTARRLVYSSVSAVYKVHKLLGVVVCKGYAQLREEITLRQTVIDEAGKQADALLREEQQLRKAEEPGASIIIRSTSPHEIPCSK